MTEEAERGMDWPKVKTVLIIVLVAVNAFLFAAYTNATLRMSRSQEQVRYEVCRVLGDLGYELNPALLPEDSELYHPARITRNTKSERAAIGATLENITVENAIGVSKYTGKNGEIVLRSGGYAEASFLLNGTEAVSQSPAKVAEAKLRSMRVNMISVTDSDENGIKTVSGICSSGGLPIFNCRVECKFEGDRMAMSGRVPMGEISHLQNITPYSVSGLMLNFAQYLQSVAVSGGTISEIAPGYMMSSPTEYESGVTELSPVWRVTLSGEYWYINALNGKVIVLE